jgi:hypothetical protein
MIVFENEGEIDPRLIMLIGVNVKESDSPIGYFGTGLKYAVACVTRWGEDLRVQSGLAEFSFAAVETTIRGQKFGVITMFSKHDRAELGFTTELGKRWEPWMVYRELWCNAIDEPEGRVYTAQAVPRAVAGLTRVIVSGAKLEAAHAVRDEFILNKSKPPLHVVKGLEIYPGPGHQIFYRGIAVQGLAKPGLFTYNITEQMYLSEDRTAGSWSTDPIIARALTEVEAKPVIDSTLLAPRDAMESRLDYDYVSDPGEAWLERAEIAVRDRPMDVPKSVRAKFDLVKVKTCPTCNRAL